MTLHGQQQHVVEGAVILRRAKDGTRPLARFTRGREIPGATRAMSGMTTRIRVTREKKKGSCPFISVPVDRWYECNGPAAGKESVAAII